MKLDPEKKENSHDGLPEIAQTFRRKKSIILVIAGIIGFAIFSLFLHTQSNTKKISPVEEMYVPETPKVEVVKTEPVAVSSNNEVKQSSPMTQEMMQAQVLLLQEKQKELQQRLSAPLMLVNNKDQDTRTDPLSHPAIPSKDPNTQFMNQVSGQAADTVNVIKIGSLNSMIAEGNLIHAILEPATNSDLPGYLRAIVSEASFSEDGSQVLIPPGSRLIGQYKSGMLQGQSRIFIVWTRLITPEGVSVQLGSPGIDSLGVAGMGADEIDRHFWERFGTASLLSLIGAGVENTGSASDPENSSSVYRAAVASSFAQSAEQSLQQEGKIALTLKTHQGKPIMVFVARDIHFAGVLKQLNPTIKIF